MERARGGPTVGQRDRDQGPPREQGEREEIHQAGRREVGVSSGWKILSVHSGACAFQTLGPLLK